MKFVLYGTRNTHKFEQYFQDLESLMIQDMFLRQNGFTTFYRHMKGYEYEISN